MNSKAFIKHCLLEHFKYINDDNVVFESVVNKFIAKLCIRLGFLELLDPLSREQGIYCYYDSQHGIIAELFEIERTKAYFPYVKAACLSTEKELDEYVEYAAIEARKVFIDDYLIGL